MIIDKIRDLNELKKLYYSRPMQTDVYNFDFIANNPHIYCFYGESDSQLKGVIFLTEIDKKLFLSGFSIAKNFNNCIDAVIKICDSYKQDIYSDTDLRHAILVLKKAGFEKFDGNIYIRQYGSLKDIPNRQVGC